MSLRELTAFVIVFEMCALGVVFAGILGAIVANGGVQTITIDMTMFGELWIEYVLLLVMMAVTPYALYVIERRLNTR
ncbi:hypothetical protein HUG10_07315 [Halorarum halophilum]|uniref:Uncharacterized protein n=1 Tax=Halorarum halophilum TaxID=2743090 RepID=A0A7D5GKL3_9EURY|nr:hypothetical protein [Halobaculum halophilum]QLG27367.1 hypothetical protein HUG10_07315 [Halobaculum halophilum]